MHTATNHFNGNNAMPRDLRSDGPAAAGAGKTYDVDPAAVERLRQHIAAKQASPPAARPQTAVPSVKRSESESKAAQLPYPAAVIAAAKAQEQAGGRRDLASVLTDEVLAVWDRWNRDDGMSMKEIGQKANNGLLELHLSQVSRYLKIYREREAETELAAPPVQPAESPAVDTAAGETAVTPPAPELPAEPEAAIAAAPETAVTAASTGPETAVVEEPVVEPFAVQKPENLPAWLDRDYAPPRPSPGDALAALATLVNNEQLRVRGSVKLNLEIEFGD